MLYFFPYLTLFYWTMILISDHIHSKWDRIIAALVTGIKNISRVSKARKGRYKLIPVTCAEIIFVSFWKCMMRFFSHLSLFYRRIISKILECREIFPLLFITALPHLCSDTSQLINKWAELTVPRMLMPSNPVTRAKIFYLYTETVTS